MFTDARSKRVVLVAHCILNQNAKLDRCAHYPGAVREIANILIDSGAGIIQMPCPEMLCLGLARHAEPDTPNDVPEEDTRIACLMNAPEAHSVCERLASEIVEQIADYKKNGFQVAGLIGINGSPTCGVETNWADNEEKPGPGIFIDCIRKQLSQKNIPLPLVGVKAYEPASAIERCRSLVPLESK